MARLGGRAPPNQTARSIGTFSLARKPEPQRRLSMETSEDSNGPGAHFPAGNVAGTAPSAAFMNIFQSLLGHVSSPEDSEDSSPASQQFQAPEASRICVIGAGAYGTAMATVAARNHHLVKMWGRNEKQADSINALHVNSDYLQQYTLHENITATTDLQEAVDGAEVIMLALPAQVTPGFLREHKDIIPEHALLCSTAKGLYLKTKQLLSAAIQDALGREQPFCLLSGPSFAKEIMDNNPTAVVVASKYLYHAVRVQRLLSSLTFRVYSSQDTVGVELGGALKNPLAIGAGMIEGMGLGTNTMAAYVTRSCNELTKLCIAMGGRPETISGLSGVGDLMLTAFGSLSRNRSLGMRLARGEKVEDICKDYTVEGVPTAQVALHYADQCNLELPLFRAVASILSGDLAPAEAGKMIMGRPLKQEHS